MKAPNLGRNWQRINKLSHVFTDLSSLDLSGCFTVRQALATLIRSEIVQDSLEALCAKIRFREFSSHDQNIDPHTISDAIEIFLESENVKACEQYLAKHLDTSETLHDLLRDVMHMRDFAPLVEALSARVVKRFPETKKILANVASEVVMDAVINIVRRKDMSSPLDALKGTQITVAYMPNFDRMKSSRMPTVNYFSEEKDATTVAPDQIFRDFMALVGVTKEQWIKVVADRTGVVLDHPSDEAHSSKVIAQEWRRAVWAAKGKPLVTPEQLFDAIDASAHGFSPLIAISTDAYRFVKRDWSKSISITGGVLGLHDFDNGTGDPLRFEGNRILEARPCQFVQPELQRFGLAVSHGFTENTFNARMKDSNAFMEMPTRRAECEIASEIVTAVRVNFGVDTQWVKTEVDLDTLRDTAAEALGSHLEIEKQAANHIIEGFDCEELAALLVGVRGRDHTYITLATMSAVIGYRSEANSFK
jgi:hypothetical protein